MSNNSYIGETGLGFVYSKLRNEISEKMDTSLVKNNYLKSAEDVNLTLNDCVEDTIRDYRVYGNSTQEVIPASRNLFNPNSNISIFPSIDYSTRNTYADGVLTAGVNTVGWHPGGVVIPVEEGDVIRLKAELVSLGTGTGGRFNIRAVTEFINNGNSVTFDSRVSSNITLASVGEEGTTIYTVPADVPYVLCGFATVGSTDAQFTDIMITKNDEDMTYEPYYVGSPTLENPSEVKSVGVKCRNLLKNLSDMTVIDDFGANAYTTIRSNIADNIIVPGIAYNNYYHTLMTSDVVVDGNRLSYNSRQAYGVGVFKQCASDTNYTVSYTLETTEQIQEKKVSFYDSEGNWLSSSSNLTFTTPATCRYLAIIVSLNGASPGNITISNIQLEEGSTATEYQEYYEGYDIPIKVTGKNLFNPNSNVSIFPSIDYSTRNTYADGVLTAGVDSASWHPGGVIIPVEEGDVVRLNTKLLSIGTGTGGMFNIRAVTEFINDGNSVKYDSRVSDSIVLHTIASEGTAIYTVPSDVPYVLCGFSAHGGNNAQFSEIMITKNDENMTYEPYTETISHIYLDEPLRSVDDYNDYIDFANGVVVRKTKEFIPASETVITKDDVLSRFLITADSNTPSNTNLLCTHSLESNINANGFVSSPTTDNGIYMYYDKPNSEFLADYTVEQFRQYLIDNNVKFYYSIPVIQDYIDLPDVWLNPGVNHVSVVSDVEPSNVMVEYVSTTQTVDENTTLLGLNQVQADWNEEDKSADSYIRNKPATPTLSSLGVIATSTELNYIEGATSNIQGQLNALLARIAALEAPDAGTE